MAEIKISSTTGKPLRSTTGKPLRLKNEGALPTGKPVFPEKWGFLSMGVVYPQYSTSRLYHVYGGLISGAKKGAKSVSLRNEPGNGAKSPANFYGFCNQNPAEITMKQELSINPGGYHGTKKIKNPIRCPAVFSEQDELARLRRNY